MKVELRGIVKRFKSRRALDDVGLAVTNRLESCAKWSI